MYELVLDSEGIVRTESPVSSSPAITNEVTFSEDSEYISDQVDLSVEEQSNTSFEDEHQPPRPPRSIRTSTTVDESSLEIVMDMLALSREEARELLLEHNGILSNVFSALY